MSGRPAVFLDRDGTLITELGYLADPAGLELYAGAADAVARLNAAGIPVVLATNQSGIARGLFDEATLERIHDRLRVLLAAEGAHLDLVLACPWHPDHALPEHADKAGWRKPAPGMYHEAARRLTIDLARSASIGDAPRDLEAAARAGVPMRILVATGKGAESWSRLDSEERAAVHFAPDLAHAVQHVLEAYGR